MGVIDYGRRKIHGESSTGNASGTTARRNEISSRIQFIAFNACAGKRTRRTFGNDFCGLSS